MELIQKSYTQNQKFAYTPTLPKRHSAEIRIIWLNLINSKRGRDERRKLFRRFARTSYTSIHIHLNVHSKAKSDARHWRPTRGINQRADCSNHTDAKMSAMNTALLFSSASAAYTVILCVPTYYSYRKKRIPRNLPTSNVYAL